MCPPLSCCESNRNFTYFAMVKTNPSWQSFFVWFYIFLSPYGFIVCTSCSLKGLSTLVGVSIRSYSRLPIYIHKEVVCLLDIIEINYLLLIPFPQVMTIIVSFLFTLLLFFFSFYSGFYFPNNLNHENVRHLFFSFLDFFIFKNFDKIY